MADLDEIKKELKEKNKHDLEVANILKKVVYVVSGLLLINYVCYFIFEIILKKKSIYYFENICNPVGIILFGTVAILLTQINPRISKTNETKGDKMIFYIGLILILGGIAYLIFNVVR